jgi:hypothetical protein
MARRCMQVVAAETEQGMEIIVNRIDSLVQASVDDQGIDDETVYSLLRLYFMPMNVYPFIVFWEQEDNVEEAEDPVPNVPLTLLESVQDDCQCIICMNAPTRPTESYCNHIYCLECIR